MIDNYNPETHFGTQPIRVLSHNVIHSFENFYHDFPEKIKNLIDEKGLKGEIKYLNREEKIKDLAFVWIDKKLAIEESFLSFLWIVSYCLIVMIDEKVQKPQNGIDSPRKDQIISDAQKLFEYGITLMSKYSDWNKELPNPERYTEDDRFYIEKANSIFLNALNFVLLHELSHVELGHLDNPFKEGGVSEEEILQDEYDADENAVNYFIEGISKEDNQLDKKVGLVAGLCSLLYFSNDLKGGDHPDPDDRLRIALNSIELNQDDISWGIAAIGLHIWAITKKYVMKLSREVESYKDWFIETDEKIRGIKTEANNG